MPAGNWSPPLQQNHQGLSRLTTRDLSDPIERDAILRTGERKRARYALNLPISRNYQEHKLSLHKGSNNPW